MNGATSYEIAPFVLRSNFIAKPIVPQSVGLSAYAHYHLVDPRRILGRVYSTWWAASVVSVERGALFRVTTTTSSPISCRPGAGNVSRVGKGARRRH